MLLSCATLDGTVKQNRRGGTVSSVSEPCSFLNACFDFSLRKTAWIAPSTADNETGRRLWACDLWGRPESSSNNVVCRQFACLAVLRPWNVFMLPSL